MANGAESSGLLDVDFADQQASAVGDQINNVYPLRSMGPAESKFPAQNLRVLKSGDHGGDRTPDLVFRKHLLYPTELRGRW